MSASFVLVGRNGDVAGAGADDFDERARGHAGADRAEVGVKRAHRDRNARRQAGSPRPFRQ